MDFGDFLGVMFLLFIFIGLPGGFCFWVLCTPSGQRLDRKQQMKAKIRRGMYDEMIEDGLFEEAVSEVLAKEAKRRGNA